MATAQMLTCPTYIPHIYYSSVTMFLAFFREEEEEYFQKSVCSRIKRNQEFSLEMWTKKEEKKKTSCFRRCFSSNIFFLLFLFSLLLLLQATSSSNAENQPAAADSLPVPVFSDEEARAFVVFYVRQQSKSIIYFLMFTLFCLKTDTHGERLD